MTGSTGFDGAYEEPDQLRDQVRQILRYRAFLVLGIALGVLGAMALSVLGADSYTSTGEVVVQPTSTAPFESGGNSPDKQLSMGTEKQIAQSATVATRAARNAAAPSAPGGRGGTDQGVDPGEPARLQHRLRVSNPPNTQTLTFEYTAATPQRAALLVNAFVKAYLDYREATTKARVDKMVSSFQNQLDPLLKQRRDLDVRIANEPDGPGKDTDEAERGSLVTQISGLQAQASSLRSVDTTPGEIVRKGEPPAYPSGPGRVMLLTLGAVVGLACGILLAWLRSALESRVRSVADVQRILGAPILGTLPSRRRRRDGGLLVVGRALHSNLAEAYRTIAFRLAHDQRFAGRSSVLVVAPRRATHAASVAVNLAGAFTEIGKDVLLVEADLRTPDLESRLPISSERLLRRPPVAPLNSGTASRTISGTPPQVSASAEGWPDTRRLVVDADAAGAFGLVPGERVPNVARVLSSPQVTRLLATPVDPNESIVVLSQPLLTHADGLALAKRVDGVIVVCDLPEVRRADLDRVAELISGAGGRILGAVLDKGSAHSRMRRLLDGGPSYRTAPRAGRQDLVPAEPAGVRQDSDHGPAGPVNRATTRAITEGGGLRDDDLMPFRG